MTTSLQTSNLFPATLTTPKQCCHDGFDFHGTFAGDAGRADRDVGCIQISDFFTVFANEMVMRFCKSFVVGDVVGALHGGNELQFFQLLEISINRGATERRVRFSGFLIDFVGRKMAFLLGDDLLDKVALRAETRLFAHK